MRGDLEHTLRAHGVLTGVRGDQRPEQPETLSLRGPDLPVRELAVAVAHGPAAPEVRVLLERRHERGAVGGVGLDDEDLGLAVIVPVGELVREADRDEPVQHGLGELLQAQVPDLLRDLQHAGGVRVHDSGGLVDELVRRGAGSVIDGSVVPVLLTADGPDTDLDGDSIAQRPAAAQTVSGEQAGGLGRFVAHDWTSGCSPVNTGTTEPHLAGKGEVGCGGLSLLSRHQARWRCSGQRPRHRGPGAGESQAVRTGPP
ncbi:MAG: hypothetical protein CMB99_01030 [Flavobacteriaceae bacterium]|nr:hypothetical protein [Flavobacteriaceae bacterium]